MSEDQRITFRMSGSAKQNMDLYCEMTGQKPSEVARAGIALLMGPYLSSFVGHLSDNSHVRTRLTNIDLSKDKSSCPTKDKNSEVQKWFKAFWVYVDNQMFGDRVIKTIKDKWNELKELDPAELGRRYTAYCNEEARKGREFSHPNAWLSGGGYKNEQSNHEEGGLDYDVS